jgi:hypothetical protein
MQSTKTSLQARAHVNIVVHKVHEGAPRIPMQSCERWPAAKDRFFRKRLHERQKLREKGKP